MRRAKVPISWALAGPYGHPYHPALTSIPIGAWIASLVFDIASHFVSSPAFLTAGSEWLIAIGVAGAILAGLAGFMDLSSLAEGTRVYRTASAHMILNLLLIVAYAGNFWWRYRTYRSGAPVGTGMLSLSVGCVLLLIISGLLGGKLAYRYGVRVADEATQMDGYLDREQLRAGRGRPMREQPPY
ncbi:MAG: DUF2231 domain-containing protein [Actinobacteria bacterium]|nr:DUF2231 domain-containing protein [Actinomycetota bacterium]